MKVKSRMGERGQVVIPKAIRDQLVLGKGSEIEFELADGVLTMRPHKDMEAVRRHLKKYQRSMAGNLEADGFRSVDDYIDFVRDRDAEYKQIIGIKD